MIAHRHHKDSPPHETLQRVQSILSGVGVSLSERASHDAGGVCHSVSLQASGVSIPARQAVLGSNGKGVSAELALASAYAEFIERLQNLRPACFLPQYGEMPDPLVPADGEWFDLATLLSQIPDVIESLFDPSALASLASVRLRAFPFFSVNDGRVEFLPQLPIDALCLSNGMCAGNSPEEALVQGFSEVCERYVASLVFKRGLELPTIPVADLQDLTSLQIIRAIERHGYRIVVKDCTLGGRYPVLGTVTLDPRGGRYHVHLGSHPSMDIALQRCLTEAFQGAGIEGGERMRPLLWDDPRLRGGSEGASYWAEWKKLVAWRDYIQNGTGPHPSSLFMAAGTPAHDGAFESGFSSNRDSLHFIVRRLQREGHRLYVRDASFLGFPTFHVYVPGMSELYSRLTEGTFELHSELRPMVRQTLLSLKSVEADEIRRCAKALERFLAQPDVHPWPLVASLCQVLVCPDSDFARLYDENLLLAYLYHRLGDWRKAFYYLNEYMHDPASSVQTQESGTSDADYYWCALSYFYLKSIEKTGKQIRATLASLFGEGRALEVVNSLSDPSRVFDHLALPECGKCECCEISEDCQYTTWKASAGRLRERLVAGTIDQASLQKLFGG